MDVASDLADPVGTVHVFRRVGGAPASEQAARKPNWLTVKAPGGAGYVEVRRLLRELKLHTVCE